MFTHIFRQCIVIKWESSGGKTERHIKYGSLLETVFSQKSNFFALLFRYKYISTQKLLKMKVKVEVICTIQWNLSKLKLPGTKTFVFVIERCLVYKG